MDTDVAGASAVAEGARTKVMVDIDLLHPRVSIHTVRTENLYRISLSTVLMACSQNEWKSQQ